MITENQQFNIDVELLKRAEALGWQPQHDGIGCWRFVKGNVIIGCAGNHQGLSWCSQQTNTEAAMKAIRMG